MVLWIITNPIPSRCRHFFNTVVSENILLSYGPGMLLDINVLVRLAIISLGFCGLISYLVYLPVMKLIFDAASTGVVG
jgi:hypothetical protein